MTTEEKKPPPWIRPGLYPALRVVECSYRDPEVSHLGRYYVVEFDVECSEVPEHPKGARVVWVSRLGMIDFLVAALRVDPLDVDRSTVRTVFESGENPLRGLLLRCEATERKTPSGRGFIHCKWVAR